jgi:alkanesulfonate monooxygenase SsuD/methylene tetrahydromethanopterin reductase-like flavin-dependent oxidoreductase (luciferase family)
MSELWTAEVAAFSGEFVSWGPSWAWPKPVQAPRPPILVGGPAAGWVFDDIVEVGDGWLPVFPLEVDQLGRAVRELRARFDASRRADRPQVVALDLEAGVRSRTSAEFACAVPTRTLLDDLEGAGVDRLVLSVPDCGVTGTREVLDVIAKLSD